MIDYTAFGNLGVGGLALVIAVALITSPLSSYIASIGWRSTVRRDAELVKILRDAGLPEEADYISGRIRSRMSRVMCSGSTRASVSGRFASLMPDALVSTVISLLSVLLVLAASGETSASVYALYVVMVIAAGFAITLARSVAWALAKRGNVGTGDCEGK